MARPYFHTGIIACSINENAPAQNQGLAMQDKTDILLLKHLP